MGESLLPDRVFDFFKDEPEPHPAYDFFALGLLPGYAGNPNNNNGWLKVDDYLLGELEAMANKPMAIPAIEEVSKPVAEAEEEQEDLAALFGEEDDFEDDDFSDDDSKGVEEKEVWELNEEWLMAPVTLPPVPTVQPPSVYEVGGPSTVAAEGPHFPLPAPGLPIPPSVIEDLSTRLDNLKYGHGQPVKKVIHVSDDEAAVQQREAQIQQLQTMVSEMSSRESTMMQCILKFDRRVAELERRPPGP
nr:hypothetical protein [Tanacetum cinerariifolium]